MGVVAPLDRADLYALCAIGEDLLWHGVTVLEKDGHSRLAPIIAECTYFVGVADPDRAPTPATGSAPYAGPPTTSRSTSGSAGPCRQGCWHG
ncbi:hypothetical protein ACM01_14770 [Streptomyces viridochromogenes]|uniref:Uncharacterized protein n=1 Tax=Streptomyces viridochromogenes TaxID=1938 RepID=A0A0J8C8G9_STRVR|nr:hypothetical protein [Streptomyces viridochromogenes]KMS74185.1 hypothetical protein ACM01_14770 [Streptomyces viridochromogenes]